MPKRRNSKTRQGLCGVTLAQGHRLTREPVHEYANVQQSVAEYRTNDGNVQMPLNRSMRRYAKHIGIKLNPVEPKQ
ncbi:MULTISPECIES: hypothetical protein [unclassified Serratia (in: enterobacteria)]|uniref:hypothetical protein n=1 Tax=unclassified Serratia (in: enterobacteria) TaxID=2647522 RepID=UPI000503A060|nr:MULTISPECIES: hypothetical protein [unclassified Serratia (in: enterobacteria)]KFK95060.1 hypothetical protein IV04_21690 [Serratia sp. Ag1]KFK96019.1 hypothetical protein JV45_06380 [Serratia sp. Ag2]KFK98100.1 hypothetical protein IV04_14480 [Serratia sp. Ag1]